MLKRGGNLTLLSLQEVTVVSANGKTMGMDSKPFFLVAEEVALSRQRTKQTHQTMHLHITKKNKKIITHKHV